MKLPSKLHVSFPRSTVTPEINSVLIRIKHEKKVIFPNFFGIESHNFVNVHPVLIKFRNNLKYLSSRKTYPDLVLAPFKLKKNILGATHKK